ncbi:MAG: hypothetical protein JXR77_03360 [Lentisphaeria bacterium]|nr:hypothetical protein [Lentisphaeria bacterium]
MGIVAAQAGMPASLSSNQALAWQAIVGGAGRRVPIRAMNIMEWSVIDMLAGVPGGTYREAPVKTYVAMQRRIGVCALDQFIPQNPLSMGPTGYDGQALGATTGALRLVVDGIDVSTPEAVVEHLERIEWPRLRQRIAAFDAEAHVRAILKREGEVQDLLGPTILKTAYGFAGFPQLRYGRYGYVPYFSAFALYPEVMEADFALQADCWALANGAAAQAFRQGGLAPVYRLDHDMADSRGTLVDPRLLDRLWLPHFSRAIAPLTRAGIRLVWHSDGNLMDLYPRLLEAGISGFQGFQYEAGMDYRRICAMVPRDGLPLLIEAGVSVTRTLPRGTPAAVRDEIRFLAENGPHGSLFLGLSSSMTPGVPRANIETLVEGLRYYRDHGR